MAFKKRRMMVVPEVNDKSFVFFFERGDSGRSWSIRDYSIENRVKEYGPSEFSWSADDVHQKAQHSLDAPTHSTHDLAFWYRHTQECNKRFLGDAKAVHPFPATPSVSIPLPSKTLPTKAFPVLNLPQLMNLPKGRKPKDMDRILHSPNSEDWVSWNFFQVLSGQYPKDWWAHILRVARCRNSNLNLASDSGSSPMVRFWSSVRSPLEYESQSRSRMLASGNPDWVARARVPEPVEGPSEIDVVFDHERFLVYVEAKLGSDVSMSTSYDPQRNQIIRNIDCLIGNAGNRMPVFWMLVRDQSPQRAYVQLMNSYRLDPELLIRDLPHRSPDLLRGIAQNLTTLQWSDFQKWVSGPPGLDAEHAAVKQELERRILG